MKLKNAEETRNVGFVNTYEDLQIAIEKIFKEKAANGYKLSYKDVDGEEVTLSSSFEFNQAKSEAEASLILFLKFPCKVSTESPPAAYFQNAVATTEASSNFVEESIQTTEINTPLDESNNGLDALFVNYKDGMSYNIDPGKTKKILIEVFNNCTVSFPSDTILSSSIPFIAKDTSVNEVKPNESKSIEVEFKGSIIPKKYMVNFQLRTQGKPFGQIAVICVVVTTIPELNAIKSKDVCTAIKKYRMETIMMRYNVPNLMKTNLEKLMDIFNCDYLMIINALKKANNNLVEAIQSLFKLCRSDIKDYS